MGGCGGFDGGDVDVQVDLHLPCYIIIPPDHLYTKSTIKFHNHAHSPY